MVGEGVVVEWGLQSRVISMSNPTTVCCVVIGVVTKIIPAFLTTHQLFLGLLVNPVVGSHGGADHHLSGVPCILRGEA